MTKEKLLQELKYTQKKHQNDHVDAFGTNISLMCADIVNVLNRCVEMSEGLTNGEVFMKMYGISQDDITYVDALVPYALIKSDKLWSVEPMVIPLDWWNRKWSE